MSLYATLSKLAVAELRQTDDAHLASLPLTNFLQMKMQNPKPKQGVVVVASLVYHT